MPTTESRLGDASDQARWREDGTADQVEAINRIICGSLRMAAARVTGNLTHERTSQSLLLDGVRAHEAVHARRRQVRKDEARERRIALSPKGVELTQQMLDALAWVAQLGETGVEGESRPRPSTLSALRKRGLLAKSSSPISLTSRGRRIARKLPRPSPSIVW